MSSIGVGVYGIGVYLPETIRTNDWWPPEVVAKWGSTQLAVKLTGAPRPIAQHGWKGFIGQAGLTLGLAGMVASLLPGVGAQVREMFLAAVLANLLIGPILLKQGLGAAGEVPVISPSASQSRKASPQGER